MAFALRATITCVAFFCRMIGKGTLAKITFKTDRYD